MFITTAASRGMRRSTVRSGSAMAIDAQICEDYSARGACRLENMKARRQSPIIEQISV
jgi:hypothetical protein